MPVAGQVKLPAVTQKSEADGDLQRPVGTEIIISKNLFDPERGAGATRETEANSRAFQRIRGMILLGTAIIGNTRQAILQDGAAGPAAPGNVGQATGPMRIKEGELVEGFQLSEIGDKRVIFSKGTSRVELVLDYFLKVEPARAATPVPGRPAQVGAPTPVVPRVIPALPRRQPVPPGSVPDTNQ